MKFINRTEVHGKKLFIIDKVIESAEEQLVIGSPMLSHVLRKDDWKYGVRSGPFAAAVLSVSEAPVPIEIYYAKYRNSAQTAAWNGKRIGINGYWLAELNYMNDKAHYLALVGAVIHEWSHARGFHHQDSGIWGYFKRNYWSEHKSKYSVPYHLSDNIGLWVK